MFDEGGVEGGGSGAVVGGRRRPAAGGGSGSSPQTPGGPHVSSDAGRGPGGSPSCAPAPAGGLEAVAACRAVVADLGDAPPRSEAECVELIRQLENLKAAAAAAQATVTARLVRARKDAEAAAGVPAAQRGRGLAAEVALARRVSPHRGGQHLGLGTALVEDMPHTLAALREGRLSEWRATLLVRESICLSRPDRRAFDVALCADPATLAGCGDRRLVAEAKRVAYRLDPHHVVARAARAERERTVSIRPAPDTMAYLTALLPVAHAVAVHAALDKAADAARATGDPRTRGQLLADTLFARVTGREPATGVPVAVDLVMTDHSLLAGGPEPAHLRGHGTVPAAWARDLAATATRTGAGAWVRRLLTDPTGHLIAMESRARRAPAGLARYITVRDGATCRTPWCDAPIRHIDHISDHARGGPTTAANLQGLCERCNYTKTTPGWHASPTPDDQTTRPGEGGTRSNSPPPITTTTPTGHTYTSTTPRQPRTG